MSRGTQNSPFTCLKNISGELADAGGDGGIAKHRRPRDAWRDLLEQLQPLPAQTVFELHEAGGVAARPRQAFHEAGADRVGDT
jgi:hypothetical protein